MPPIESLLTNGVFAVFLAVLAGVLLGEIEVGGFSLGVSGVLFAGLGLGAAGFTVDHAYFTISLVLFVAAVGLLAGEEIGGVVRAFGFKFAVIGVFMTVVAAGFTNYCVLLFRSGTDPWVIRGTFAGAVTSSPGLAAALEAAPPEFRGAVSAGYSLSYPVGVVTIILFQQLAPQVTELDVAAERRRFGERIERARTVANGGADEDRTADGDHATGEGSDADQGPPPNSSPASVPFSLAGYSLSVVVGALVGLVPIPLGPLGVATLGVSGGTLLAALLLGHLRHVGPFSTRMSRPVLVGIREVAMAVFLAVVGIEASAGFLSAAARYGPSVLLASVITSIGTMVLGFVLAVVVWDLDWIAAAGAINGGMTSTPGLGAAINSCGTEEVGATYGATYPFALLAKVIFSKVLVLIA